jgi:sigma-B regulation protein RsbU (phosphoserine phosphatase)
MKLIPMELESRLRQYQLWPESRIARGAVYVLSLDIFMFALQLLTSRLFPTLAAKLGGWVSFLSSLAIILFIILAFRYLRSHLLWRLRNRLIVTYVFIGVIPVLLLVVISAITLYLLAGQFASFVVTSDVTTHLRGMEAANKAIAGELATQLASGGKLTTDAVTGTRSHDPDWSRRQICAWAGAQKEGICSTSGAKNAYDAPPFISGDFRDIVRDHGTLYMRSATEVQAKPGRLRVISSEPLDKSFMQEIAADLGEITLYEVAESPKPAASGTDSSQPIFSIEDENKQGIVVSQGQKGGGVQISGNSSPLTETFTVGSVPAASNWLDHEITFGTPLVVVDWANGNRQRTGALVSVQTRPSVLYERLFAALGDFARGVEYILFFIAIIFALIEIMALVVGTMLTRSITSAVAQLYEATKHINRADFSHRIRVRSTDQLATLANSFNSMTASIEKLILEQKEKQRLENELAIAQEVQAQLFPKKVAPLETLEMHGFCRPARTVSGDYYDFLTLNSHKLILAVGDVSGKGISAALLMATIHSAVRAYSLEGVPLLQGKVAVGAGAGENLMFASDMKGAEVSPASLLSLLNHQLYASTPQEKYATLFLGIYDGQRRELMYSNGGHLPPILVSEDGSSQLLTCGGTVVGLLDEMYYPETTIQLRPGDIFVAYSDGVTEPENDYGEFGEQRLIDLVRENRHLPLVRITEIVTAALDDWIGDNEQPDDVTLVLARAK